MELSSDDLSYLEACLLYPREHIHTSINTISKMYSITKSEVYSIVAEGCSMPQLLSVHTDIGSRSYNEDRYLYTDIFLAGKECTLVGIFDGHGGKFIVNKIIKHLPFFLSTHLTKLDEKSIKEVIEKFDLYLRKLWKKKKMDNSGSTATICIFEKYGDRKVWLINLGDSRGIIFDQVSGETLVATQDHKPDSPEEKERIEKSGGFVSFYGVNRVNGILAVSRAFGDFSLKPHVSSTPDVYTFIPKKNRIYILVLASDGLWDVINNETPADMVKQDNHSRKILSKNLVEDALKKGTSDNTTVVTVKF